MTSCIFAAGQFWSKNCVACGYEPGAYWTRTVGDSIYFRSTLQSSDGGKFEYSGRVLDGRVEVTIRWTQRRWYWSVERNLAFAGTLARWHAGTGHGVDSAGQASGDRSGAARNFTMQAPLKRWRWLVPLAVYVMLLIGGFLVGRQLFEIAAIKVRPGNEPMVHTIIMTATGIFILASAMPFVPGAEVGFALLVVFGAKIAMLVYVGMVAALLLAYLVGRLVPVTAIGAVFAYCGFTRAHRLVLQMEPLDANARIALLVALAPPRVVQFLLRSRHLGQR